MSRIPETAIHEIRNRADIISLISRHVELKQAGRNWKGLCPFHNEKTPSFNVSPDRQVFHCFGCGQGGDAFKFLMLYENMSFMEAVTYLAERAGLEMPARSREAAAERSDRSLFLQIHAEASRFYRTRLFEHPGGLGHPPGRDDDVGHVVAAAEVGPPARRTHPRQSPRRPRCPVG